MNSPEWDGHRRLLDQVSADQDAAAAAAAAAASASIASIVSAGPAAPRGRAQNRTLRSIAHDDGSRSRSRSFTIPIRAWGAVGVGIGGGGGGRAGAGERRQRWVSQDSEYRGGGEADFLEDDGSHRRASGSGSSGRHSSSRTSSVRRPDDGTDDGVPERPSRSRSFFQFAGWGIRGRGLSSARDDNGPAASPPQPAASDSSDASFPDSSVTGGSGAIGGGGGGANRGVRNKKPFALGGRKRATSTAGIGVGGGGGGGGRGGVDSGSSRTSRFSSFSGGRQAVTPSIDPSPEGVTTTAVTFDSGPSRAGGGGDGGDGGMRSGKPAGILRSNSLADERGSAAKPEPPQSARFPRSKGWGRGRTFSSAAGASKGNFPRRRAVSTAVEGDVGVASFIRARGTASPPVPPLRGAAAQGSGGARTGGSLWMFARKKRAGGGKELEGKKETGGKRGVWGSLQVCVLCVLCVFCVFYSCLQYVGMVWVGGWVIL